MGALSKLIFGGDGYYDGKQRKTVTPEPATLEVGMTEADFSNKNLGAGGAIIIGAWISHKDNGALIQLDVSSNNLTRGKWTNASVDGDRDDRRNYGTDMAGFLALADGIRDSGTISTVIVNTFPLPIQDIKSKAELVFSGKELKVEDITIIAALIPSNVSHKPYISSCYR
jgi:hypothetical protein